ncbi:MAG TPA: hypothetical protein VFQ89_08140 [Candidatus Binatia bacterium]|nr:hypothetical protein [Candidatus Binatia bacterium]
MREMNRHPLFLVIAVGLLVAASGCAGKRIVSQWNNPDYASAPFVFKKIMVLGAIEQEAIRRNFEDRFVAALGAAGVEALPSYRLVAEPGKDIEGSVKAAVQSAGADGALVTRLIRVEQRTDASPGYYQPYFGFGYYNWHHPGWYGSGYYTPPYYYQYPVYYSETTLYNAAKNEIVWTGTIRTIDPENANEAIEEYVATVVTALRDNHLLPSMSPQGGL